MKHYPDKSDAITDSSFDDSNFSKHPKGDKAQIAISMHENVPVWYDCCSCEAEPYWLEAMEAEENHERSTNIEHKGDSE